MMKKYVRRFSENNSFTIALSSDREYEAFRKLMKKKGYNSNWWAFSGDSSVGDFGQYIDIDREVYPVVVDILDKNRINFEEV